MRRFARTALVSGAAFLVACGHAAPHSETATAPTIPADAAATPADAAAPSSAAADAAAAATAASASASAAPAVSAALAASTKSTPVFESQGTSYSAAALHDVFEKNQAKLLSCFLPAHKRDATLRGHVNIKFAISADGKAGSVQDQGSNLPDPKVIACVIRTVKTLRFAKPEGSVTVQYPIIFHSDEPFLVLPEVPPGTP